MHLFKRPKKPYNPILDFRKLISLKNYNIDFIAFVLNLNIKEKLLFELLKPSPSHALKKMKQKKIALTHPGLVVLVRPFPLSPSVASNFFAMLRSWLPICWIMGWGIEEILGKESKVI